MQSLNSQDRRLAAARTLLQRRKPGYSLEAPFYTSQDMFDLDIEGIWATHWFHVGVEAQIPERGDYFTIELGQYSVILIRGTDMQVRAFHNVCRHRGARILNTDKGSVSKLICQYHNWTYDLAGPLVFAEHMAPGLDKSCLGLKPVHLRNICGLLFICLADHPPADIEEMHRTVEPYLAPHEIRACRVAKLVDVVEEGNWKVVMENNRECYHCSGHPELLRTFFQFFAHTEADVKPRQKRYYERYCRIHGEMVDTWDSLGLPWKLVELLDDRATAFRLERMALDRAGESYTLDTKAASKRLLGKFETPRLGALSLHTQPNSWNHFLGDHAAIFFILPLAPEKTLLRTIWLVHKDAEEGKDYDLDNLTTVWSKTNAQDKTFVEWTQKGVRSPAYEPGPYSPNENQLEKFLCWYIDRLGAHVGVTKPMPRRSAGKARTGQHA